jgi:hypothetical protein
MVRLVVDWVGWVFDLVGCEGDGITGSLEWVGEGVELLKWTGEKIFFEI